MWGFARKRKKPPRIFFVAHNRHHVRLFAPAVAEIERRGQSAAFVDLEAVDRDKGARRELARRSLVSLPLDGLEAEAAAGNIVVVANDWAPPALVEALQRMSARNVVVVGLVEGFKSAEPMRYRQAQQMLAMGPASGIGFAQPTQVVGSPVIEAAFADTVHVEPPLMAVISEKFIWDYQDHRAAWLAAATAACVSAGLRHVVSRHPSYPAQPGDNGAPEEFGALMRRAAVLITRPSTAAFEAMARGKPVVVFPVGNEGLFEFVEPLGAFETISDPAALPAALDRALASLPGYRRQCADFLARHVSYDPKRPAAARIADALAKIAGAPAGPAAGLRSPTP